MLTRNSTKISQLWQLFCCHSPPFFSQTRSVCLWPPTKCIPLPVRIKFFVETKIANCFHWRKSAQHSLLGPVCLLFSADWVITDTMKPHKQNTRGNWNISQHLTLPYIISSFLIFSPIGLCRRVEISVSKAIGLHIFVASIHLKSLVSKGKINLITHEAIALYVWCTKTIWNLKIKIKLPSQGKFFITNV